MVGSQQSCPSPPTSPNRDADPADTIPDSAPEPTVEKGGDETAAAPITASKFFIVKSLTLQDLELSVRNGIWATQSHNEDVLNKAFHVTSSPFHHSSKR